MAVDSITNGLVGVVHVLASINIEVFLLSILDIEHVSLDAWLVFSEVGAESWSIQLWWPVHEQSLEHACDTNAWKESPSYSHLSESWETAYGFTSQPETTEPCERIISRHCSVEGGNSFSIFQSHVIRKEVASLAIGIRELIEPFEAIVFYQVLFVPWASWYFSYATEVA